jgi:hypothetical protein
LAAYEDKRLPQLRKEHPGLRLQQYKDLIYKEFQKVSLDITVLTVSRRRTHSIKSMQRIMLRGQKSRTWHQQRNGRSSNGLLRRPSKYWMGSG